MTDIKEFPNNPWAQAVLKYDDPEKELKFKNRMGAFKTEALFFEVGQSTEEGEVKPDVLYTLKDADFRGLPSLRRLYLECKDPSEYTFATQYFYSWEHWCLIRERPWIKEKLAKWREELNVLIQAEALVTVIEEATNPISRSRLAAAKFLLESRYGASNEVVNKTSAQTSKDKAATREEEKLKEIQIRASKLLEERNKGANIQLGD